MYPVFFRILGLTIRWYGMLMATGFLAGLTLVGILARRRGRSFSFASDLLFWVMISGILGARIVHVLANWKVYSAEPLEILRINQGGLVYYGGFLGAGVALWIVARIQHMHVWDLTDLVVPALPLGHALGRIGCFMNGCCHGAPSIGSLAVRYPAESPAWITHVYAGRITRFDPLSLPVHPTQFYAAAANLVICGCLVALYVRRSRRGTVTAAYLLLYPPARFLIEFLRGDERVHWGYWSSAQVLGTVLFAIGVALWMWSRNAKNRLTGRG